LVVLALIGILIAGALGFVVARATRGSPSPALPDKQASAGSVQISFPFKWHRQAPLAGPALGLTDVLAVGPSSLDGGVLVIGRSDAGNGNLLPQPLLVALSGSPPAQVVTLGGIKFYRYSNASAGAGDASTSVYALPTSSGTVIGMCLTHGAPPGFTTSCERVLATLRVTSGSVLPPGQSVGYASDLNSAINKLNAVRSSAGSQLREALNAQAQATAANALAVAHANAASALGRLNPGPADAANSALVAALGTTANAYASLARAAEHNDAVGYSAASKSVTSANKALNSALDQLSSLGYHVG
jgi:hypothetical protein